MGEIHIRHWLEVCSGKVLSLLGGAMIYCCGRLQRCVSFMCDAPQGFLLQRIDFLCYCKQCKHTVLQVSRLDVDHKISWFRRTDDDARKLFDRLRTSIQYRITIPYNYVNNKSSFSLGCNVFGRKQKCYSNLSSLLDVGESLLPLRDERIILPKIK